MQAPFALAFTAGLVASVNPCGFAMLPAYLSFLIGTDDEDHGPAAVGRALRVGLTVSVGFVMVFGAAGLALTAGARWITGAIPWAALLVGIALAVGGAIMLTGRSWAVRLPGPTHAVSGNGPVATALFGVSYAVASLSCTLPVFLVVIGGAGTQDTLGAGVGLFATYAAGMALPLLAVTVALALGKQAFVRRVRGMARYTTRMAGGLLVAAGGYIVFYWATVLVPQGGRRAGGALVTSVEDVSSRLTTMIGSQPLVSGFMLVATIVAAIAYSLHDRDTSKGYRDDARGRRAGTAADPDHSGAGGDEVAAQELQAEAAPRGPGSVT
ncbi:MAG: cytochrome c biogenesis CcdA family protein [Actinomycetota bacterium]|jgi:cytochrome c biogenesis protein CcdA|nr:cytochrome c biogenesis CcdA family protein [Actinomycetota bacterium]